MPRHLRRFGPSEGLPLVALPGLNDGLAPVWKSPPAPPPAVFAADPVVVLSYPEPLAPTVSTRDLAGLLAEVLDAEVGPCVVSGHSMGAMVALHLAADRPDLVRGLCLSAAVASSDATIAQTLLDWEEALTGDRHLDFHRSALEVAYTGDERTRRLALLDAAPPARPRREFVARHLALSGACRTHDARDRLSSVRAPTVVLAGQHDPLTTAARSRELADALADARFELVPGVGHGFPEQAAERYTHALDRFIHGELTSRGRT